MSSSGDFAVFINSKSAIVKSTQKSQVSIPFVANLSKHDPNKFIMLGVNQFGFTNSVYNIVEGYDTLQVCVTYDYSSNPLGGGNSRVIAVTSGPDQNMYELINIKIPHMNYNFIQFADYLTLTLGYEIVQQLFSYNTSYTYNDLFIGWGAKPLNTEDPVITPAASADMNLSKIVLSTPDLNHLTQFGCDKYTPFVMDPRDANGPTVQPGKMPKYSYLMNGVYLVTNADTVNLMKLLGFVTIDSIPKPIIPGTIDSVTKAYLNGYGTRIVSKALIPETIPPPGGYLPGNNTVIFGFPDPLHPNDRSKDVYSIDSTSTFDGLVVEIGLSLTVPTLVASMGATIPFLDPGKFINGALISTPSPYISSIQQAFFTATYSTAFTTQLTAVTPAAYSIMSNGMAICNGTDDYPADPISTWGNYITSYDVNTQIMTLAFDFAENGNGTNSIYRNSNSLALEIPQDGASYYIYGFNYHLSSSQVIIPLEAMTATLSGTNPSSLVEPYSASNFSGLDEIYLHCAQLHTQFMSSENQNPLAPNNTVAVIPVDSAYGTKGKDCTPTTPVLLRKTLIFI